MTCADCIHHGVCRFTYDETDPIDIYASSTTYTAEKHCDDFFKADIQEVKHGKWIFKGVHVSGFAFKCSICGRYMFANEEQCNTAKDLIKNFPFCHCGAKMKGEKE